MTEVTEAMVDAVDWNSGRQFSAFQQNPAAWMNAIVAWAIKRSIAEISTRGGTAVALKDLIATPGEVIAARITRGFDFSSDGAHERLFNEIWDAVNGAVAAERAAAQHIRASAVRRADEHARAAEREACARILLTRINELRKVPSGEHDDLIDELEHHVAAIRARGDTP